MKKRILSLFLALLLLTLLLPTAFAEEAAVADPAAADSAPEETAQPVFPYVLDNAGLLLDSQREALEQKAAALSDQHQCALYIVTVQDYTVYSADIRSAVKGIQEYYKLGDDTDGNAIILMLSMQDRDYWAEGFGEKGNALYDPDESSWLIEDAFLDNLRDGDWYGGFEDFLDACGTQLTKLENGEDINEGAAIIHGQDGLDYHEYNYSNAPQERSIVPRLLAVILIPCLVALIVCSVFKAQMKTAHEAVDADAYLVPHSVNLRVRQDRFTHRTETRTRIESQSQSSGSRGGGGGGGSFHVSGGGSSGRGGKF